MTQVLEKKESVVTSSSEFAALLKKKDFSGSSVLVVGHGNMGKAYVKAFQVLGVQNILVCSRSEKSIESLKGSGIRTIYGGHIKIKERPGPNDMAVVATSTDNMGEAIRHLMEVGYKKILCEKPVSFWSSEISNLAEEALRNNVDIVCAFNRLAFSSFLEARYLTKLDGGITSCRYDFTELTDRIDFRRYTSNERTRWGVANSLHVFSMAHGLIGLPKNWSSRRSGETPWHPTGSIFVGEGVTKSGVLFVHRADWTSKGRWLVEVQTSKAIYQMSPLEKLSRKKDPLGEWEEVALSTYSKETKSGLLEQVAAMLDDEVRQQVPFFDLQTTSELTRFGEEVFGYASLRTKETV